MQFFPDAAQDALVEQLIKAYGFDKLKLPDAAKYGLNGAVDSWKRMLCQLCKRESNFNPKTTYAESGHLKGQISTGLFQMSYSPVRSYAKFASGNLKKLMEQATTENLKDPEFNIQCMFVILNRWLTADKVIARKDGSQWKGGARYWSPFRKADFAPQVLARKPIKETPVTKKLTSSEIKRLVSLHGYSTVKEFQKAKGLTADGIVGPITTKALLAAPAEAPTNVEPIYPKPHRFHPRFKVKAPCTHPHPIDVLRSVAGEKEIAGSRHNPLIAHFHEHSGNLGKHSDTNDYSDEVPHCSSALNWVADMAGCEKTDHALAASWKKYGNPRKGDWVEEGDIIVLGTRHVTLCNKRFNRKTAKTFEGFGSNQGNTIKTSPYKVAEISSVQVWKPLPGTVSAPIGMKAVPVSGKIGEGTT